MTRTDTETVKEAMHKIIKRFGEAEEKINWIKCPCCSEEWTKLMPCRVWVENGDKKKEMITSLCVSCAENAHNLERIAIMWPMEFGHAGLNFQKRLPKAFRDLPHNLKTPSMWIMEISTSNSFSFEVEKRGSLLVLRGTGIPPEEPMYFDNSVGVWFWLRNRFENGEPVSLKKKW